MTVLWHGGNRLVGLSSDEKPVAPDGSIFFESDTENDFARISGEWVQRTFGGSSNSVTSADISVVITAFDTYLDPKLLKDLQVDSLVSNNGIDFANSDLSWDQTTGLISGPPSASGSWSAPSSDANYYNANIRGTISQPYGDFIYTFGGNTGDGGSDLNLIHRYHVPTTTWQNSIACTGTAPGGRWGFVSGIYKNFLYVTCGQYGAGNAYQDIHRLNLDTFQWSGALTTTGTKPNYPYLVDGFIRNGYLWLFAGYNNSTNLDRINLDTLQWSGHLTCSGTPPTARYGHSFSLHNNYGYMFGGAPSGVENALHRVNLDTLTWSGALTCSGTPPSARMCHSAKTIGDYLYIAHGTTSTNLATGASWQQDIHRIYLPTLAWSGALSAGSPGTGYARSVAVHSGAFFLFHGLGNQFTSKVEKYTPTPGDITLIPYSWEASANDPKSAYAILKILPGEAITLGTDLKAYVSMDDGSNYEEISGLEVFQTDGSYQYVRGTKSSLTARGDKTMRLKVTTHNNKVVRIASYALGVSY